MIYGKYIFYKIIYQAEFIHWFEMTQSLAVLQLFVFVI